MAGISFSFTGNSSNLLKNIGQVQNALNTLQKEAEANGTNFDKFFKSLANGGVNLTKALSGDANEIKKLTGTIKANFDEMQKAWDNLTDDMKQSSMGVVIGNGMTEAKKVTQEVTDHMEKQAGGVNKTAQGWNGLNAQVQMLAREVPNLANSFQIFMMAIGNNLPMLADEIKKAKDEIEDLKKAGKEFTPVWQQAWKAIFNWQTALIAAITVLTAYGDDIAKWVKDLFNMNEAFKTSEEILKAYNKALGEGAKDAAKEKTELDLLYKATQDANKPLKERVTAIDELRKKYPDYFNGLSNEAIMAGKAADSYKFLSDNIVQAARARAIASQIEELQAKRLEAEAKQNEELNKQNELAIISNFGKKRYSVSTGGTRQLTEESKAYNEAGKQAAKYGKEIEELDKQIAGLAAKVDITDLVFSTETPTSGKDVQTEYLKKQAEFEQAKKDAINKGNQEAAEAMKDGYLKQLAQMDAAHQTQLNELDKEKADFLQKKIEVERAKAEASGTPFDASKVKLSESETAVFDNRYNKMLEVQAAEIQGFYSTLAQMQQAANTANKSLLEQQLAEIDAYYQEQISKAEGFEELKTQLTKNHAAERARAENEARLRENQQGENLSLMSADVKYQGTGLTERAEQEKTKILIKYAQERIEILRALGDEQSQAEADTLAKQIEAYNKQLKQPMSVKGWFDSKVFDKLKAKYIELGDTEEQAEEKAAGFFTGVQTAATQTVDAVGLLQTALGGISEGLDEALNAIGSVASGFASGGMVGGIAAAAGVAIGAISKLGAADYSQYNALVEQYDGLIDVWDTLIEKKSEYVNIKYGDEAQESGEDAIKNIEKQIAAYEELGIARLNSGGGWFSHTIGVRQRKGMSDTGWKELQAAAKKIGFDYNSVAEGRMKGLFSLTAEQLAQLQEQAPAFWSKLDDDVREYLENIISCQDQIDEMKNLMNEAVTGVSFDSFYDNFISTLTDMESDSEDFAEDFGNYLKNAIMQNIVANKYKTKIQDLYDSWVSKSEDGLTAGESKELKAAQDALAAELIAERDSLANTFGWLTGEAYKQEASKGVFEGMSQDMGNELNGRFTAFQASNEGINANTKQMAETINLVLSYMPNFEATMSDILVQHAQTNGHLEDIVKYTKVIQGFGATLQQIAENTKNL